MANTEKKNNFIESIKFNEDFLPFKGDDEIYFGGKEEMGKIIEFYLKNKGVENWKKNAERFKINCVLGNNGGGKSRLFESIIKKTVSFKEGTYQEKSHEYITINDSKNYFENNIEGKTPLLDDLFFLGTSFSMDKNVNSYLSTGNIYNSDNTIYNKVLLLSFLLEKKNINLLKNFNKNINYFEFKWGRYGDKIDLTKYFRMYFLYEKDAEYIKKINFSIKNETNIELKNILLKSKLENINFKGSLNEMTGLNYGEFIKYNKVVLRLKKYFLNKNITFNDLLINFILDKFLFSVYFKENKQKQIELKKVFANNISGHLEYDESLRKYKNILSTLGKEDCKKKYSKFISTISSDIDIKSFINYIYEIKPDEITFFEKIQFIELISSTVFYNINIEFNGDNNYTFNDLSAGEKISFLRFTNTYSDIIYYYLSEEKKIFTILIDEPDLHLHLEWQQKYIQKLIDVFSKLDTNIKLHFIIATHSPFIISDLPKECLVLLDKGRQVDNKELKETFGANYVDIIRNGFFFKDKKLMGGFAEETIGGIAEERRTMTLLNGYNFDKDNFENDDKKMVNMMLKKIGFNEIDSFGKFQELLSTYNDNFSKKITDDGVSSSKVIQENIGDDFVRNNLLYFVKNKDAKN